MSLKNSTKIHGFGVRAPIYIVYPIRNFRSWGEYKYVCIWPIRAHELRIHGFLWAMYCTVYLLYYDFSSLAPYMVRFINIIVYWSNVENASTTIVRFRKLRIILKNVHYAFMFVLLRGKTSYYKFVLEHTRFCFSVVNFMRIDSTKHLMM